MPIAMAKNYSNCPLKKRPIVFDTPEEEPENLSTKPEDLSRSGRVGSVSPPATSESPVSIESSPPGSPQHFTNPPLKVELCYPPPISPEYAPTTWHRSVAPPIYYHPYVPYAYHHEYMMPPTSPYSESSLSPPHHHHTIQQPVPLRPIPYTASLSPNSSTTTSPPPIGLTVGTHPLSPEDLTSSPNEKRVRHQCPDCGKSYSTFSGLSKHRQFHCAAGDGPKKSFSCKYCEKVYISLGALKMHIRTHTLPCKCTICGKAFSRPWLLQGHIRTHTGEKPFSCTYCNRAFADRSNLRAHLQTHSDVKKYSCQNCSKTFSRMSLLTKHTEGGCSSSTSPQGLMHQEKMHF